MNRALLILILLFPIVTLILWVSFGTVRTGHNPDQNKSVSLPLPATTNLTVTTNPPVSR